MMKIHLLILSLIFFLLSGCATIPEGETDERDPFESFNRTTYGFNSSLDKALLKPIAKGYDAIMPEPAKIGMSNFFANLKEIPTIVNDLFQGKFSDAVNDSGRLLINTTLGLAGFIDVASDLGLEQHDEDFGQTLGVWGFSNGAYLVLPFLGPSTVRQLISKPVDNSYYSPIRNIDHIRTRNTIYALEILDLRYRLLAIDSQLEDAFDEYSFVRDAYLMRTQYQVYDGNPPEDDFYDDECFDDEEDCEETDEID